MSRLMVPLICAILLTAASPLAAATPDPTAPLLAVAVVTEDGVLVEWVPGTMLPDYYAVYGEETDGDLMLLTTVLPDETGARVPFGFSQYRVTAVTGTTESNPVIAVSIPGCVWFDLGQTPPDYRIGQCKVAITSTAPPAGAEGGVGFTESESDMPEGASIWANVTIQGSKACASWVDGEDPTTGTDEDCE